MRVKLQSRVSFTLIGQDVELAATLRGASQYFGSTASITFSIPDWPLEVVSPLEEVRNAFIKSRGRASWTVLWKFQETY